MSKYLIVSLFILQKNLCVPRTSFELFSGLLFDVINIVHTYNLENSVFSKSCFYCVERYDM